MSARPPRTTRRDRNAQPQAMTRRQLSRHQREVRNQRIALIAVALALAVAILVPVYGYVSETYLKGGEPMAVVQGQPISTEFYARFLGFEELLVQRQAQKLSDALAKATDDATKTSLQQQQQSLQQRSSTLTDDSLTYLIERPFVAAEAQKRGITASQADLDLALRQMMSGYPKYGILYQGLSTVPDNQLESLDQAKADLNTVLAGGQFLTADQVTEYALTQSVLRGKLLAALSEGVPTSGEEVHARHILVATLADAQAARDRIVNKGEDFATVAKEVSTDTSTKDKGGDLGWFPKDQMVKEFSDVAFSLQVNEISQPVQTTYGYHIIQVLEKDPNRQFDQSYVAQEKATKYSNWISAQEAAPGAVDKQNSTDTTTWAQNFVTSRLSAATK